MSDYRKYLNNIMSLQQRCWDSCWVLELEFASVSPLTNRNLHVLMHKATATNEGWTLLSHMPIANERYDSFIANIDICQ